MPRILAVMLLAATTAPAQLTFSRRDAASSGAIGLIAADFNGDGKADIAEVTFSGTVGCADGPRRRQLRGSAR